MIPLALTRFDIADYVAALFLVYLILTLLNILLGWMPRMPFYSRWFRAVLDFITETTDPYLNVFRRITPSIGPVSLAGFVAVVVLLAVGSTVDLLIRG